MTYEEIVNAAKTRLRKSETNDLDDDIRQYIEVVLSDLKRIGVHESRLQDPEDPLIIEAILVYVRAYYAMDQTHEHWKTTYNEIVGKIKMNPRYKEAAGADA